MAGNQVFLLIFVIFDVPRSVRIRIPNTDLDPHCRYESRTDKSMEIHAGSYPDPQTCIKL
jgi:hypothetical protein